MLHILITPFAVAWAALMSGLIFAGCVAADVMRFGASLLVLGMTGRWEPTNVVGEVALPRLADLWASVGAFARGRAHDAAEI